MSACTLFNNGPLVRSAFWLGVLWTYAATFLDGAAAIVLEARVDCSRTDSRFSCSRVGLVTVSYPPSLRFDINGVQEVTLRVLPPAGKAFRFRPADTFSLTAGVDLLTRRCNVTQQYQYAVASQTIPIRFTGASRSPSVDAASGQIAYQEGKQYPDTVATFTTSVSFVMGPGDSFLAKGFEATIPLNGGPPQARCRLQDWNGNITSWMSTFTSSYYLNGRNMRVLSLVDENTRVDRYGVPVMDDEEDIREERDFRDGRDGSGDGNTTDPGSESPRDPFADWFNGAGPHRHDSTSLLALALSTIVIIAVFV